MSAFIVRKSTIVFVTLLLTLVFSTVFPVSSSAQDQDPAPKKPVAYRAPLTTLVMRTLDTDADGELSDFELAKAPENLLTLDKNGSGDISLNEMGGPGPIKGMLREQLIIRVLDVNGDLALSPAELQVATHSLKKLDRDKNSHLGAFDLTHERFIDPDYTDIPLRKRLKLNEYAHQPIGDVLPNTHEDATRGFLLIQETSNHNDVQMGRHTYLVNQQGQIVHGWYNANYSPQTASARLLPNGLLWRTVSRNDWLHREQYPVGAHGMIELVDWDGTTMWSYNLDQPGRNVLHHDFEVLPSGNILVMAYVGFKVEEAAELGFDPDLANGEIVWFDSLIELQVDFENKAAKLTWQWNSWDHIVQDRFPDKPNYGVISEHPDRIDINANDLKTLPFNAGELHHINSISYNETLDHILLSSAGTGELWVIDHSTTRAEAATANGGNAGKGGRLLYRWGNPNVHDGEGARKLFWQHDATWLPASQDSLGNTTPPRVLVFNGGLRRAPDGSYNPEQPNLGLDEAFSDLMDITLPLLPDGTYDSTADIETDWTWNAAQIQDFYAPFASSATRLENGHTLFVDAHKKHIFEIKPDGERVLDFIVPGPGNIGSIDKIPPTFTGLVSLRSN